MGTSWIITAALAALASAAPALAQQTTKYTLVIVASGANNDARRDGVSMMNMGVYPGRQECETAGKNVQVGSVTGGEPERPSVSISYLCVPLGRP